MQLKELIQGIGIVEVDGPLDRDIFGLTCDPRRVMPGMVYVAVRQDGTPVQAQVELALARGAAAVVSAERRLVRQRATKLEVRDIQEAMVQLGKNFFGDNSAYLRVIAVVGTIGQHQTALILKQLLDAAGLRSGLISSERHEIGERRLPGRFFPDPCELQDYLAQMRRAGCAACVIELSRQQLLEHRLEGLHLDAVVFTQLDSSETLSYDAQTALIRSLKSISNRQKKCRLIINVDESSGERLAQELPLDLQLAYGWSERAHLRAANVTMPHRSIAFSVQNGGRRLECSLPLVGRHNVYHVLAAIAGALSLDLAVEGIRAGLRQIRTMPGNLELISGDATVPVYVDGARAPEMLWHVLKALKEITPGRLVLVFGCPERSNAKFRYEMGRIAAQWSDYIILTSDDPGKEPVARICGVVAQGLEQNQPVNFEFQEDRAQAIYRAIHIARPGDAVIIAGKGERTYQEMADTIVPFDDRECARECLEAVADPYLGVNRLVMGGAVAAL